MVIAKMLARTVTEQLIEDIGGEEYSTAKSESVIITERQMLVEFHDGTIAPVEFADLSFGQSDPVETQRDIEEGTAAEAR